MKGRNVVLLATVVVLALAVALPGAASAAGSGKRYVVVFSGNTIPKDAAESIAAAGGQLVKTLPEVGVAIAVSDSASFAAALKGAKSVTEVGEERFMELSEPQAYVQTEDGPTPQDSYYVAYQWDIRRVKADQAWAVTSGSHNTVVAVIDTGIAWNHPDLFPNVVFATCYSALSPTCLPYPSLSWHGTHVAGTIAAAFGGGRAVGVGPNLGLASYNVFDLYNGGVVAFDESIWAAMLDAASQRFRVINMSLGGYVIFPLKDAAVWTAWNRVADYVTRKGVTIVASSGNAGANLNGPVAHIPSDLPAVIGVGGTGIRPNPFYPQPGAYDVRADYSNYGAAVTLVAPGGDLGPEDSLYPYYWYFVFSTYVALNSTCPATASCPTSYAWAAGTSMASPHAAGVAGLVIDREPRLNPHQVAATLKQTAEPLGDRQLFGHGMVDAAMAVGK